MKEIRPMVILLCLIEEFKKQQVFLLKSLESMKDEEFITKLHEQLCKDHDKINETSAEIYKTYSSKILGMNTIEEFLSFLGAPAEAMQGFAELAKLANTQ